MPEQSNQDQPSPVGKKDDAAARAEHEKQFLAETAAVFHGAEQAAAGAAALGPAAGLKESELTAEALAKLAELRNQAIEATPPDAP